MAVSKGGLIVPKTQPLGWDRWWKLDWQQVWPRQKIIADVFRLAGFSVAIVQVLAFPNGPGYNASELTGLIIAAGLYSILKIAQPFNWQRTRTINVVLLSVDMAASATFVHLSGGIHSPFILYTLLPVLTAALVKDYTVTVFMAVITGVYVLLGNIYNPATNYMLTLQGVNDFLVYIIALGLVTALPYAVNLRMGQQIQASGALAERRRLSHELHDSICQTLCGLRWQFQRFSERMPADNNLSEELNRVEEWLNTAEQDARSLLDVLRTIGDNSTGLLPTIKQYLEQLKSYAGISYRLDGEDTDIKLSELAERELAMICIEILANIKKHAGAANILFSVRRAGGRLQIKITDDGCGFDVSNKSPRVGHGLNIMRERAELIGGNLQVVSADDHGTAILVDIPEWGGEIRWQ